MIVSGEGRVRERFGERQREKEGREEQKEKARSGNDCWWNSEGTGLTGLTDYLIMNDFIGTIKEDVILIYIHIHRT